MTLFDSSDGRDTLGQPGVIGQVLGNAVRQARGAPSSSPAEAKKAPAQQQQRAGDPDYEGEEQREYADAYLKRIVADATDGGEGGSSSYGDYELQVQDRTRQPPTDDQMRSILQYLKNTPPPVAPARSAASSSPLAAAAKQTTKPSAVPSAEAGSEEGTDDGFTTKPTNERAAATLRRVKEFQAKMAEAKQAEAQQRKDAMSGMQGPPGGGRGGASSSSASAGLDASQGRTKFAESFAEGEKLAKEQDKPGASPVGADATSNITGSALSAHLQGSEGGNVGAPSLREGPLLVWWDEGVAATSLQGARELLERIKTSHAGSGDGKAAGAGSCTVM